MLLNEVTDVKLLLRWLKQIETLLGAPLFQVLAACHKTLRDAQCFI